MLTSIFSAGNTYTYCAVRNLYGLSLEGRAPKFLRKCTRSGVPIYCFCVVMIFPILSFLSVSNDSSVVIGWFASLVTAGGTLSSSSSSAKALLSLPFPLPEFLGGSLFGIPPPLFSPRKKKTRKQNILQMCLSAPGAQIFADLSRFAHAGLIDYLVMCVTYIFFYRACKAQGVDRSKLPYTGWFQPYCAYVAAVWLFVVTCMYGYTCYLPWSVSSFFSQYSMQLFIPPLFVIWKLLKRTKMVKPHEADLVWQRPIIDAYEATFIDPPSGFWKEMVQLVGFKRTKGGQDRRRRGSSVVVV